MNGFALLRTHLFRKLGPLGLDVAIASRRALPAAPERDVGGPQIGAAKADVRRYHIGPP